MSTKHFKMLSHLLLTSECNGEDFVLYQPSLHLLWWYRVLHTSTSCRVGLLRQLYHLIVTWHDIHSSTHSFTHLFQSVHLSIEVWYIEHAQCSVQPQTVHIAGSIWYTATSQHCLDTLQQVKHTPNLLVLQIVIGEILDKLESNLHTVCHLRLIERGTVNYMYTRGAE